MLDELTEEAREALCVRCGTACYFAIEVDDVAYVFEELRCRFLTRGADGRAGCLVYAERFERAPWCADLDEAFADGLLGHGCAYPKAAGLVGYRGKRWLKGALRVRMMPFIRETILEHGVPLGADEAGLRLLMARTGGGRFGFVEDEGAETLWVVPEG